MRTRGTIIIPLTAYFALFCWPGLVIGETNDLEDRIFQFNAKASQAWGRGEVWPCNPVNQAKEWFVGTSVDSVGLDQFSCKGSPGDSVAVVSLRGNKSYVENESSWFELRFERPTNQTWRLTNVVVKSLEPTRLSLPSPVAGYSGLDSLPAEVPNFTKFAEREYSVSVDGIRMILKAQPFSSVGCGPKVDGVPLGHWRGNHPSPYSIQQTGFCVLETGEISVTVVKKGTGESLTFPFGPVEPSLYMVEFDRKQLGQGGFVLQVWYNSFPTSIKFVMVR